MEKVEKPTILLADDDATIRDSLAPFLERAGFHVIVEKNGADVFRKAQTQQPDLIILDILMPIMDGREVLLVLSHLFRKKGSPTTIDAAVEFLAFRCRYGSPSIIRKLLSIALRNEMISREEEAIKAEFIFDLQTLSPNQAIAISKRLNIKNVDPLY